MKPKKMFWIGFTVFSTLYLLTARYITSPSFEIKYGQKYSEHLFYIITFLPRYENDGYELMQLLLNILVYGVIGGLILVLMKKAAK